MKKQIKKAYIEVIEEIMKRCPEEYAYKNMVRKIHGYAETKKLLTYALEEDIDEKKKERFKNILDSGELDDPKYFYEEVDPILAKKKEEWVEQELLKYVERGELPKYVGKNINREIRQRIKNERNSTKDSK